MSQNMWKKCRHGKGLSLSIRIVRFKEWPRWPMVNTHFSWLMIYLPLTCFLHGIITLEAHLRCRNVLKWLKSCRLFHVDGTCEDFSTARLQTCFENNSIKNNNLILTCLSPSLACGKTWVIKNTAHGSKFASGILSGYGTDSLLMPALYA